MPADPDVRPGADAAPAAFAAGRLDDPAQGFADGAEEPPLTPRQRRQLEVNGAIVLNPSFDIGPTTRRGAAEELIALSMPQAVQILDRALRNDSVAVRRAVIEAIVDAPVPPPGLLDALVEGLGVAPPPLLDPLAAAVARYPDAGVPALATAATDRGRPAAARLGPIHALAVFRSREAAEQLIGLLDVQRGEPPEVIDAACRAMQRLTGSAEPRDAAAWRQWWTQAESQPQAQWLERRVERLGRQLEELSSDLQAQRNATQRIEQRLLEAYRTLFPGLPYDEQLRRLPELLEDELDIVRQFAIGRIDRLMRDTVNIPEPLQALLAERLDDPLPGLRCRAAQLLDELGYAPATARIADRLAEEREVEVLNAFLRFLAHRPTITALDSILQALDQPALTAAAADALWGLALRQSITEEHRAPICAAARRALDQLAAPTARAPLTGVLALLGTEEEARSVVFALDGPDAALRAAVAQALARRGMKEPLLERVGNAEIYPHALQAIAAEAPTAAGAAQLMQLVPPAGHRQAWTETLRRYTEPLSVAEILVIDDRLRERVGGTAALRRDLLERVLARPAAGMAHEQRAMVSIRLANVLVELGQRQRAQAVLEQMGENGLSAELRTLRLEAALRASAWELAAAIAPEPAPWIDVHESFTRRNAPEATTVHDEIIRRFGPRLGADQRRRLERNAAATLDGRAAEPDRASAAADDEDEARP